MMIEQEHNNVQWKKVKLGDVCAPSSEKYNPLTENDFSSCIEMENINQESGTINGKSDITKLLSLKNKFHKGEVLYGKLRPYLRKYWLSDCEGACSTEIWVLKSAEGIDNQFLFYLFQSDFINKIANLSSGTKMPRADWAFMKNQQLFIPFKNNKPDLSAQRRIAAILTSADKVIAATQKTIAKYKQIKQGMMEDLLKPKEGWKKVRLGEVGEIITGPFGSSLHEKDYTKTGTPIVNPQNIVNGRIIPMDKCLVSDETVERLCKFKMNAGDIVIARRGEMGRCAVVEENQEGWLCGTGSFVIKVDSEKIDSNFIQLQLSSDNTKIILENNSIGATMSNLNQGILCELEFLVPDLPEQRRIAKMLSGIDRKIAAEEKVLEKYEKMKKGLMERMLNK